MADVPAAAVADEASAYRLLEQLRWGAGPPPCPHCGRVGGSYFLRPAGGVGRRTRTGAVTARRVWKCGACRRQFSVLTNTVLHGSRLDARSWVAVLAAVADGRHGGDVASLIREHGLSRGAATHVSALLSASDDVAAVRAALPDSG